MNAAAGKRHASGGAKGACGFAGHLRVRKAAAEEARALAGLFADPVSFRWARETLAAGRGLALVVERFEGRTWVFLGFTVTAGDGETALALHADERGRGLAHEALRAAVRVLREEPYTELTAFIDTGDARVKKAFEKAGFFPAGPFRSRGRLTTRYIRSLRGDGPPFNVWI